MKVRILYVCLVFSFLAFGCSAKQAQAAAPTATSDSGTRKTVTASTTVKSPAAQQPNADPVTALESLGFYVYDKPIDLPIAAPIPGLAGEPVKVSDFTGNITLLNFWATWCPPCRAEMPSIERLYKQMSGTNFRIVAVDAGENRSQVASFIEKNTYTRFLQILAQTRGKKRRRYFRRRFLSSSHKNFCRKYQFPKKFLAVRPRAHVIHFFA